MTTTLAGKISRISLLSNFIYIRVLRVPRIRVSEDEGRTN